MRKDVRVSDWSPSNCVLRKETDGKEDGAGVI